MLFGILIQRFVIVIWVRDDLIKKSAKLEPAWREKILAQECTYRTVQL